MRRGGAAGAAAGAAGFGRRFMEMCSPSRSSASGTGHPPRQIGSPAIEAGRVAAVAAEFEKGIGEKQYTVQKKTPEWGEEDAVLESNQGSPARPSMPAIPTLALPTVGQAEEAFASSLEDLTAAGLIVHNIGDDSDVNKAPL